MADYRQSYRKTIGMGLGAGLMAGLFCTALVLAAALPGRGWSWWHWAVWALLLLPAQLLLLAGGLVAVGGLIALRRDARQSKGQPFVAPPREWSPGPLLGAARGACRAVRRLTDPTPGRLWLRPGEVVTVRPLEQILATLDADGRLDGLPFMPEMAALTGRSFRVLRRVDKINDYIARTGLRRMRDAVLLDDLRCSGTAHGGCQASCQLVWKEAWLGRGSAAPASTARSLPAIDLPGLEARTRRTAEDGTRRYVCQMTDIATNTTPMGWLDPRHWLRDLVTGNVRPGPWLTGVAINAFVALQHWRGGLRYPYRIEKTGKTTPSVGLNLQPGERVRVKSLGEIEPTLNYDSRNRGLWFDRDMIRYCGGEYRVRARLERIVNEKTGQLVELATPIILLDGVTATGEYLAFTPQNDAIFWREIWLERVDGA